MHLAHRRHVEFAGRDEVGHLSLLQFAQDIFDARGALEGRYEFAAKEFALRKMQAVVIGIDCLHGTPPVKGATLSENWGRFKPSVDAIARNGWALPHARTI